MLNSKIHVAVGVIRNQQGEVLITQRAKHVHQGGLWEFPGGKLEKGESVLQALQRELFEEIGIQVITAKPLIKINYDYPDRSVLLDVWDITSYSGVARSCEDQAMHWKSATKLSEFSFPPANLPIIKAVKLPEFYAILEGETILEIISNCEKILELGVKILQVRIKKLSANDIGLVLQKVLPLCRQQNVFTLVNSDLNINPALVDGLHLTSRCLQTLKKRPQNCKWLAASCHNIAELKLAEDLDVDFAVLAPIKKTTTHPDAKPITWEAMTEMLAQINIPVYAMGGLALEDLDTAIQHGAQGIAGISAFL